MQGTQKGEFIKFLISLAFDIVNVLKNPYL